MKKLYNFNDFLSEGKAITDSPLIQEILNSEVGKILINTVIDYYKYSRNRDIEEKYLMRDNGDNKIYFPTLQPNTSIRVYLEKFGSGYKTYDVFGGRISNDISSSGLDEALLNLWKRFVSITVREDQTLTRKKFAEWINLDSNKDIYKKNLKISDLELMYKKTLIEGRREASKGLTDDQIMWLNSVIKGKWKLDNNNLIEVKGEIVINSEKIEVPISKCSYDFSTGWNLESLEGMPKEVGGNVFIQTDKIKNLVNSPEEIVISLTISSDLNSLKGMPKKVGGRLRISKTENLKGIKELFGSKIGGRIDIGDREFNISVNKIIELMDKESLKYEEALLRIWSTLNDETKKVLIHDLPKEGLGKTIRTTNKFGMNI